jgi:hypothetical protein
LPYPSLKLSLNLFLKVRSKKEHYSENSMSFKIII